MNGQVDGFWDNFKGKLKQDQIERRSGRAFMVVAAIAVAVYLSKSR